MNDFLLDANLLIAAHDQDHVDHLHARAFVDTLSTFYTCPMTQGAFLRFFTRPWKDAARNEQPPRMSPAFAMVCLKRIMAEPKHRFIPDELSFDLVSMRSLSGFKQWNDAYLIALAKRLGAKLATLERKLDNMDEFGVIHKV